MSVATQPPSAENQLRISTLLELSHIKDTLAEIELRYTDAKSVEEHQCYLEALNQLAKRFQPLAAQYDAVDRIRSVIDRIQYGLYSQYIACYSSLLTLIIDSNVSNHLLVYIDNAEKLIAEVPCLNTFEHKLPLLTTKFQVYLAKDDKENSEIIRQNLRALVKGNPKVKGVDNLINAYVLIGISYEEKKCIAKSRQYYEEAIAIAQEHTCSHLLLDGYTILGDSYKKEFTAIIKTAQRQSEINARKNLFQQAETCYLKAADAASNVTQWTTGIPNMLVGLAYVTQFHFFQYQHARSVNDKQAALRQAHINNQALLTTLDLLQGNLSINISSGDKKLLLKRQTKAQEIADSIHAALEAIEVMSDQEKQQQQTQQILLEKKQQEADKVFHELLETCKKKEEQVRKQWNKKLNKMLQKKKQSFTPALSGIRSIEAKSEQQKVVNTLALDEEQTLYINYPCYKSAAAFLQQKNYLIAIDNYLEALKQAQTADDWITVIKITTALADCFNGLALKSMKGHHYAESAAYRQQALIHIETAIDALQIQKQKVLAANVNMQLIEALYQGIQISAEATLHEFEITKNFIKKLIAIHRKSRQAAIDYYKAANKTWRANKSFEQTSHKARELQKCYQASLLISQVTYQTRYTKARLANTAEKIEYSIAVEETLQQMVINYQNTINKSGRSTFELNDYEIILPKARDIANKYFELEDYASAYQYYRYAKQAAYALKDLEQEVFFTDSMAYTLDHKIMIRKLALEQKSVTEHCVNEAMKIINKLEKTASLYQEAVILYQKLTSYLEQQPSSDKVAEKIKRAQIRQQELTCFIADVIAEKDYFSHGYGCGNNQRFTTFTASTQSILFKPIKQGAKNPVSELQIPHILIILIPSKPYWLLLATC